MNQEAKMEAVYDVLELMYREPFNELIAYEAFVKMGEAFGQKAVDAVYSDLFKERPTRRKLEQVLLGYASGLSDKQIALIADPRLGEYDMEKVRIAFEKGQSLEHGQFLVEELAKENYYKTVNVALNFLYSQERKDADVLMGFKQLEKVLDEDRLSIIKKGYYEAALSRKDLVLLLKHDQELNAVKEKFLEITNKKTSQEINGDEIKERLSTPIRDIFENDSEDLLKALDIMIKEDYKEEASVLFGAIVEEFDSIKKELSDIKQLMESFAVQSKVIENTVDGPSKQELFKFYRDAAEVLNNNKVYAEENERTLKFNILSKTRNALHEYSDSGKLVFMSGMNKVFDLVMENRYRNLQEANRYIDQNRKAILRLNNIENELSATANQFKNLFNSIKGKNNEEFERRENRIINVFKVQLKKNTERQVKRVNRIMGMIETLGSVKDEFCEAIEDSLKSEKGREKFSQKQEENILNRLKEKSLLESRIKKAEDKANDHNKNASEGVDKNNIIYL